MLLAADCWLLLDGCNMGPYWVCLGSTLGSAGLVGGPEAWLGQDVGSNFKKQRERFCAQRARPKRGTRRNDRGPTR